MANYCEGVIAVVLQAALVEVREIVKGGVIVLGSADVGEVDAIQPTLHEDGEIRGIGHLAIDRHVGRATHRARQGAGNLVHDPEVALRGFKHETATGGAPGLKVHNEADPVGHLVEARETACSVETEFLTVGEEQDNRAREGPLFQKNPGHLEEGCNRCPVVTGAGTRRHGIVVAGEENGRQIGIGRRELSDQVAGEDQAGC